MGVQPACCSPKQKHHHRDTGLWCTQASTPKLFSESQPQQQCLDKFIHMESSSRLDSPFALHHAGNLVSSCFPHLLWVFLRYKVHEKSKFLSQYEFCYLKTQQPISKDFILSVARTDLLSLT